MWKNNPIKKYYDYVTLISYLAYIIITHHNHKRKKKMQYYVIQITIHNKSVSCITYEL